MQNCTSMYKISPSVLIINITYLQLRLKTEIRTKPQISQNYNITIVIKKKNSSIDVKLHTRTACLHIIGMHIKTHA